MVKSGRRPIWKCVQKAIQKNLVENMAEIVAENKSLKCMGCKTDMNHRAIIYYLSKLA